MALTKKQDSGKKEPGKKEAAKKEAIKKETAKKETTKKETTKKETFKKDLALAKKDLALSKEKKDAAKKEPGKKELAVKKDKVNRIEEAQKFFRGVLNELKKVHWPSRREIIVYTSVVLVAVVVVGFLIWVFDSAMSSILKLILHK